MVQGEELIPMVNWLYDLILWVLSILVDLFFREVHPRGAWRVPRRGPVLFVGAPHANQFVDPLILMHIVRNEAKRRIAFLIAEKSLREKVVGPVARAVGCVPVGRAMDSTRPGKGMIYLPDPDKTPLLVHGAGTQFDKEAEVGGLIVLPLLEGSAASADIAEILGPEELLLKKEFKGTVALKQLTGKGFDREETKLEGMVPNGPSGRYQGTTYKVAPKIDQTKVYDAVFRRLNEGGCVGIFPEGGSHDRTELLPLKAGVAIMALGSLAANPNSGLQIVPCGMNYFHAHKFRSRAVVEFGPPVEVPAELVDLYRKGERREAIKELLNIIYQSLVAVTVTSPDYDTLMLIQAARRLYNPKGKKFPLPTIVELNRRLAKGYVQYKDDPRMINLRQSVNAYNKQLWLLGVRDHQVEYARFSVPQVIFTLFYRLGKLAIMTVGTLPGFVLFAPIFAASKIISIRKSRAALAASTVKLQGRDVMATWKLIVSLVLAPLLYATYAVLLTWWTYRNRVQGYVPEWVPLWMVIISSMIFFPAITFAALRFGETAMDIVKSLRPLILSLNPSSANTLVKLREKRATLSAEVTDLINTLGPEMYPDFDSSRIVDDPFRTGGLSNPTSPKSPRTSAPFRPVTPPSATADVSVGAGSATLPRNESLHNLSNVGLFASRPPSRSRSRSGSQQSGFAGMSPMSPVMKFTNVDSEEGQNELTKQLRESMIRRGHTRRRKSEEGSGWDFAESTGTSTPTSEEGHEPKKDL